MTINNRTYVYTLDFAYHSEDQISPDISMENLSWVQKWNIFCTLVALLDVDEQLRQHEQLYRLRVNNSMDYRRHTAAAYWYKVSTTFQERSIDCL